MLKNRQEGLTTLHGIWVTILVSGFFLFYVWVFRTTGWIDHWSFLLDIKIVLATIKQILFPPKSAH